MSSSYSRFLDSEKISKRFWACRPRNPSCGLISLERGCKFWLWSCLAACSIYGIRLAYLLLEAYPMYKADDGDLKDVVRKKYIRQNSPYSRTIVIPEHPILEWFSKFIVCCFFGYYTWKLIQVVKARDVPKLQSRFIIMCLVNFIWFPMLYFEIMDWVDHLRLVPHINIPAIGLTLIFQIVGLTFTYSYISTLISAPLGETINNGINQPHDQNVQDNGDVDGFGRI